LEAPKSNKKTCFAHVCAAQIQFSHPPIYSTTIEKR
jgi:hypothetical protein